jgi:hypothetical protein
VPAAAPTTVVLRATPGQHQLRTRKLAPCPSTPPADHWTRGRHNNEAFLYQKFSQEADHEHAKPVTSPAIHQMRRGNKYSAEP